ncbi:MAG TPA: 4-hydroxythreonine-4-phosphate dehydrogenase PdxA [Pyrinomonadaceae bacterium]
MKTSPKENLSETLSINKILPRVAVTIGDAAGIGAEITLKAISDAEIRNACLPVIIGDAKFLLDYAAEYGLFDDFAVVGKGVEIPANSDKPVIYDLANLNEKITPGVESAATGRASAEYIETAVRLWKENQIDAIATAPISKKALALGGYDFPGHTEFLAYLTNTKDFAMSFFAERLRVVLLSTHVSLIDAINLVKKENLERLILFTNRELERLLQREVKIAVAGLNPHASESGMFGAEEASEIVPAIEECREKHGINVSGAYSPDTIFLRGFKGEFDAVIACYHDQATIAVKCLSFGASVNVTLGLPLIRTSVDHGTAIDIAGKNVAEASSMKAAINLAADLSKQQTKKTSSESMSPRFT